MGIICMVRRSIEKISMIASLYGGLVGMLVGFLMVVVFFQKIKNILVSKISKKAPENFYTQQKFVQHPFK